jgi:hypothetical protein
MGGRVGPNPLQGKDLRRLLVIFSELVNKHRDNQQHPTSLDTTQDPQGAKGTKQRELPEQASQPFLPTYLSTHQ